MTPRTIVISPECRARLTCFRRWNYRRWEAMLTLIDERQPWIQWQHSVVRLLRAELNEAGMGFDEIDWTSWRAFYEEGRSPRAAIDRALERDY